MSTNETPPKSEAESKTEPTQKNSATGSAPDRKPRAEILRLKKSSKAAPKSPPPELTKGFPSAQKPGTDGIFPAAEQAAAAAKRLANVEFDDELFFEGDSGGDEDAPRKLNLPDNADPAVPYVDVVRRPGPTFTEGEITLHTRIGHRLFYGRRRQNKVEPIIGLVRFVTNTNGICRACELDDPYADARLLHIEEAFDETEPLIKEYLTVVRELLSEGESRRVKVKRSGSVKPSTFTLRFQYTYGFRGADLLGLYDELVDAALAARHIGRLGNEEWYATVQHCGRKVRHVFSLSANFRYTGAQRDDFAANNARARSAIEKYGELPADVLAGDRRPRWAPAPRRGANNPPEAGAD